MSRVRVTLNYVDIAVSIRDIKLAETFEEVVDKTNRLERILDEAAKQKEAEFLNG
ncbi:MAG: hypothetical protein ACW987_09000 [Candidatus Thorarchaeota archaeon]|jgi:hypothetical protein